MNPITKISNHLLNHKAYLTQVFAVIDNEPTEDGTCIIDKLAEKGRFWGFVNHDRETVEFFTFSDINYWNMEYSHVKDLFTIKTHVLTWAPSCSVRTRTDIPKGYQFVFNKVNQASPSMMQTLQNNG